MSSAARGVFLNLVSQAIGPVVALVTFPLIARNGGAEAYGAYAQALMVATLVGPFAALGLANGMVRFFAPGAWDARLRGAFLRTLGWTIAASSIIALGIFLAAGAINTAFLGWIHGETLFRWSAPLLVLGAVEGVIYGLLRAREWYVALALTQVALNVATAVAAIVLLPTGQGVVALLAAICAAKAILLALVGGVVLARVSAGPTDAQGQLVPRVPAMVRYGLPLTIASLGLWLMNLGSRLVIGARMSAADLGLYVAVFGFAAMLPVVNGPLNMPLYPRLMRAIASKDARAPGAQIETFQRYQTILLFPAAVFLAVAIPTAVHVFGGADFETTVLLSALLVVPLFLSQWNSAAYYVLQCQDRTAFLQNAWLLAGLGSVALCFVLVGAIGLIGAALASLLAFLVLDIIVFRAADRIVPIHAHYRWRLFALCGLSAVAAGAGSWWVLVSLGETLVSLVAAGFAFVALYGLLALALRVVSRKDLDLVRRALLGRVRHPEVHA